MQKQLFEHETIANFEMEHEQMAAYVSGRHFGAAQMASVGEKYRSALASSAPPVRESSLRVTKTRPGFSLLNCLIRWPSALINVPRHEARAPFAA